LTMSTITLQDIQRDPLAFLERIEAGEPLLLMHDDRPVAEIMPVSATASWSRPFGLCAGQFTVPADFDRPLPEDVLKGFEGQ
jgi:antitoxin (DNA-binding transcriptional repressor) of toxin-antitoxin stability system